MGKVEALAAVLRVWSVPGRSQMKTMATLKASLPARFSKTGAGDCAP